MVLYIYYIYDQEHVEPAKRTREYVTRIVPLIPIEIQTGGCLFTQSDVVTPQSGRHVTLIGGKVRSIRAERFYHVALL